MKTKEAVSMPQTTDEESRREFLIKAGKMALYIPPAMMVLMHPSRNAFACSKSVSIRPNRDRGGNFSGHGGPGHGGPGRPGPRKTRPRQTQLR